MSNNSYLFVPAEAPPMPAADAEWIYGAAVPSPWTLNRTTAAYGRGPDGRWTQYPADTPRPYHHPVTKEILGLLVEPARTQLLYSSRPLVATPIQCAFTDDTTTQTPLGVGGKLLVPNTTNAAHGFDLFFGSTNRASALPDNSTVAIRLIFKPIGTIDRAVILPQLKTGSYQSVEFTTAGGGSILASSVLWSRITPDTDGFFCLEFAVNYGAGTTGGAAHLSLRTSNGTRVFAGDGTSGFLIAYYGAEIGAETTSPIVSSGSLAAARAEDILQAPADWMKVGGKSLGIQYTPLGVDAHMVLNAAGADTIELYNGSGAIAYSLSTNGVNVGSLSGKAPAAGIERTNVITAAYNLFWLTQDGKRLKVDQDGNPPNAIDMLRIGARSTGGMAGPMIVRRIKYWSQALDREAAAAFSANLAQTGEVRILPVIDIQAVRSVPANVNSLNLTVTLSGEPEGASVSYRTLDGTATAGTDYTATNGRITFVPGESLATITVTLGTRSLTQDRSFTIELFSPNDATLGNRTCLVTLTKATPTAHAPARSARFNAALPADWSLTRTTPGRARGADGVWVDVPAGQPRIHYSAADDIGLLPEPPSEQRLFDSVVGFYLSNSTRTLNTTNPTPTGPRSSIWRETTATGAHLLRALWNTTGADWPTGDFTLWAIVKPVGARTRYRFSCKGIDNVWKQVQFDLSGNGSVLVAPADVIPRIEPEPMFPGWYRLGFGRTQGASAGVNAEFDMGPVDANNNNSLPGDVNNGFDLCHIQCEPGLFWTSPIPVTAATAKTVRSGDVLKAAGGWQSRESFALGVKFRREGAIPANQRIVQFRDIAPSVDDFGILTVNDVIRAPLTTGATFHGNIDGPAVPAGTYATALVSIDTSRYALFVNGTKAGETPMAGKPMPRLVEHLRFGSKEQDGSQAAPIVLHSVGYWTVGLSDDEGEVFSTDLTGTPPGEVEPPALPVVSIPAALTVEEGKTVSIPVTKLGSGACSVSFTTKAQTASYGSDYQGIGPVTVSFAENESAKTLAVQTLTDSDNTEVNEKFGMALSAPVGCTLGNAVGVVTITEPPRTEEPALYARAIGFASEVNCGEGQAWYIVTSIADSGAGTLREAAVLGARNIVFAVGGTIQLKSILEFTKGNVTVHGETAPYPGILIQNLEIRAHANNLRFKHLTIEKGYDGSDYGIDNGDAAKVAPGASTSTWSRQYIHFYHCHFLWSQDEMVEVWPSGGSLTNLSFHDCIFSEALWKPQDLGYRAHIKVSGPPNQTQHNYALLLGFGVQKADVQYCVFTDCDMRFPFIDHGTSVVLANNMTLNTTKGATIQHNKEPAPYQKMLVTSRGYLCISGPQSTQHSGFRFHAHAQPMYPGTRVCVSDLYGWKGGSSTSTYKTPGNEVEYSDAGKPYCTEGGVKVNVEVSTPPIDIPNAPVKALTAQGIYDRALKNAGPRPKERFGHTARVMKKVQDKAGKWVNHESEVGGRTPYTLTTRKLDGSAKFADGTIITAPPTFSNPPTATQIAAGKAWIAEFTKRVQYDE